MIAKTKTKTKTNATSEKYRREYRKANPAQKKRKTLQVFSLQFPQCTLSTNQKDFEAKEAGFHLQRWIFITAGLCEAPPTSAPPSAPPSAPSSTPPYSLPSTPLSPFFRPSLTSLACICASNSLCSSS